MQKLIGILKESPSPKQTKNTRKKYKIIACALDKKGRVLATRMNDYECSHPLQKYFAEQVGKPEAIYLHAEIAALIAARKEVHKLLIARVDNKGNPLSAKPCPICAKAIEAFGVKEIEHT
ncbi:hypothetical protein DQT32_04875 [Salmonella enterica subsp. enterica serovar Braenderup]|nr:hypothetical protein [Salmonella enterica subsp. enterica serovar Braenderup]